MAFSMLKIRRPLGRLIFNMGIAIPGKTVFLIETAPWSIVERVKFSVYNMVYKSLYLLLGDEQLHAKGQAKYHYNKCSWLESLLDSNNWECKLLLHVINVCSGHIYLSMLQHKNMNENASFVWYMFKFSKTMQYHIQYDWSLCPMQLLFTCVVHAHIHLGLIRVQLKSHNAYNFSMAMHLMASGQTLGNRWTWVCNQHFKQ